MAKRQPVQAICIFALLWLPVSVTCQEVPSIPATHGTTLAGTETALPEDLKSRINIIVVGFSHASQEQIANWGRLIAADYGKSADISYFELAMLASFPKIARGMMIKHMGSSVPFDERSHYIPVIDNEPAWRTVAHYNKSEDAYVLLVDNKGLVLWQTEGEATDLAYRTFKQELEKRLSPTEAP